MIVALFILLHDHRISVFLARRTKLYSLLFPLRQHALDNSFPKHVYSVVRSPSQCKELLENFRSYYNCRRFGVLLPPKSTSDVSHACKFSSLFFLFTTYQEQIKKPLWQMRS